MSKVSTLITLESIELRIKISRSINEDLKSQVTHDIKAALLSYAMMIESLSEENTGPKSQDTTRKIAQLQKHELTLKLIAEKFIEALMQHHNQRESS
jgi:hypothetical protein